MNLPISMAAWTKSRDEVGGFSIEQHPVPVPQPGEVLIKTKSTSICGTDLHIWKWDEWSRENVPLGTVTGHETCGEVVALGDGVDTHLVGDIVAIECHLACWDCPRCDEGNAHICENGSIFGVHGNGAFAPYFTIPSVNARHIPKGLDPGHASIQDPLGNAIHTLTGGPVEGATVAVGSITQTMNNDSSLTLTLKQAGVFTLSVTHPTARKYFIWNNYIEARSLAL